MASSVKTALSAADAPCLFRCRAEILVLTLAQAL
jgi:hypothetical protein